MRIALDIRYRTESGASSYIHNLLPRLSEAKQGYQFVLIQFANQTMNGTEMIESIVCPDLSPAGQALWDQVFLPGLLIRKQIDLYHSLKLLGPRFSHCPRLIVAHSITSSFHGDFPLSEKLSAYWITLGKYIYRSMDHIIAVSEYVRDYLVEVLAIHKSQITVVYSGIDPRFRLLSDEEKRSAQLNLSCDKPFLLTVGNIFPVKNHLTAVLSFQQVAEQFPALDLVMVGKTDHLYYRKVKEAVDQSGLDQRIHFLGFVDGERLVSLYNRAEALIMPSLTEGCPISLLEAMNCGLPVIGSRRGGIPEVGKKAIRLINDPFDIPAWASAIKELLQSPEERSQMRDASVKRASEFSWQRTARQTLTVYDAFLSSRT